VSEKKIKIKVEPRYVREEGNLRPFQREALEVIKSSSAKVIHFGASIRAGKSSGGKNA